MQHTSEGVSIDHMAIGILRHKESLVLVHQGFADGKPHWVLPGGLVEPGELILDALVREVREEAGAHVTTIRKLAFFTQIDRPDDRSQTFASVFEVDTWHGALESRDPDGDVVKVELVPMPEAIHRLASNGAWRAIQEPLLAYLRGEIQAGTLWFYRERCNAQVFISRLPS